MNTPIYNEGRTKRFMLAIEPSLFEMAADASEKEKQSIAALMRVALVQYLRNKQENAAA